MTTKLTDHIRVYENMVVPELCDLVVQRFERFDHHEQEGYCPRKTPLEKDNVLVQGLNEVATDVFNKYFSNYHLEVASECYQLDHTVYACYELGDFYKLHTDSNYEHSYGDNLRVRTISMLLYLNDDFEGGELEFPYLKHSVKPKKGSFVVFPTGFLYPHQVGYSTNRRNVMMFFWYKTRDHNEIHWVQD